MLFYQIFPRIESYTYLEVDINPEDFYCIGIDVFGNEEEVYYQDKIGEEFFNTLEELVEYRKNRLEEMILTFKSRIEDFEKAIGLPMRKV